ncbi:hypothetical protein SLA2020_477700 [Shorea laevis]
MGTQIPATNDRTRTYWTPTMERYFIDLMLEQMHRGNRMGHTFNKQAWTDMLAVFNAKFGSQYDKDVLKSRYTNLWKQFNDVKNLLGQTGFSWDEARQMVLADDYVWSDYIKAHPDARCYKTKPVLNFNDLCLIYGYTVADGRYSRSSHDVDFDDEVQGLNPGEGIGNLPHTNTERSRTEWSSEMDQFFIELMLDQVGRGNKTDNTFNKQAWTDMLTMFNAKFGSQHGKRVLRHRFKKLWKYYSDATVILKRNGFSWDDAQQMITAEEDVWDAYIKAHPHSRTYKMKTLPNYNDLSLIFGDAIDEGNLGNLPQECNFSRKKGGEQKGSAIPSDPRTRTFWTPPMDRFLIDLLLDQVYNGNKLGQTFITQAWIEMITLFNAKFGSHHDKEVLKNRFKHLRRMYNEIKLLLGQSGFSWDEKRAMVTAEDNVWDSYIKAHPDARSYRVKTLPRYDKLCVIFGEEIADGRYNRLAQNVDHNSEISVLMTGSGDENNGHFYTSIDTLEFSWTPTMDLFLIDLLLEQVHEGNRVDSLNEQAWITMTETFNEKFGLDWDKNVLENRYMCLMKEHDVINKLLDHGGFVWDDTRQMIVADNDVWEAYIKENPEAASYRNKLLGHYSNLCKIFQDKMLDERPGDGILGTETDHTTPELLIDEPTEDLQCLVVDVQMSDQCRKRPAGTSDSGQPSKSLKTEQEMQKMLSKVADAVNTLVTKRDNKNSQTMETAVDALQALPDIDDELLLDACDLLEDERKAKTFLALDVSLRKKWLLRKLRPQL